MITRFVAPNVASNGRLFTDAQGEEMQPRQLNYRPTWHLKVNEPVAGNYYPKNRCVFEITHCFCVHSISIFVCSFGVLCSFTFFKTVLRTLKTARLASHLSPIEARVLRAWIAAKWRICFTDDCWLTTVAALANRSTKPKRFARFRE